MAKDMGMRYDSSLHAAYSLCSGYWVEVTGTKANNKPCLQIAIPISRNGAMPDQFFMNQIRQQVSGMAACLIQQFRACFLVEARGDEQTIIRNTMQVLGQILQILQQNGYHTCDDFSGREGAIAPYAAGGKVCFLDQYSLQQIAARKQVGDGSKDENILLGCLGATLGCLGGVFVILLLSKVGIVASFSGLAMGFLALGAYKKLAGKMSKTGVILCVIMMILSVWLAVRLDWTFAIMEVSGWGFLDSFLSHELLLIDGSIGALSYLGNYLMVYLFAGLGS